MKVPTIWIRNPKTGDRRKVNLSDWASDLGRGHYHGWTALTDASTQGTDPKAEPPKQTTHEVVSFVQEIVEKPEVVITTTQPEPKQEAPKPSPKPRPSAGRPRRGKPTP